jgi:hypothetical protein
MTRSPDGREVLLWHDLRDNVSAILVQEHNPNVARLAQTLGKTAGPELANIGGNLNRLRNGQFAIATKHDMLELCTRDIVSYRYVNHGTNDQPKCPSENFWNQWNQLGSKEVI